MTFGVGVGGRVSDLSQVRQILDIFAAHGHKELDTARMYCDGNTEEVLAALEVQKQFVVATKAYPFVPGEHQPERLKKQFRASLAALKTNRVDIFYLHAPDHTVPFAETLKAVQELYEEGTFGELALSNYAAWEVMQIWYICKTNGYVMPTLYQGMYNCITRAAEPELFPCLRELGIRFYAYNPLCGGLLSGHYVFTEEPSEGRFDPKTTQGDRYRKRYWNETYFSAIEAIKTVCAAHGIRPSAAAHRWMVHHSRIDFSKGDGIIIGASSIAHAEQNLSDCEEGPLPADVVAVLDSQWVATSHIAPTYFR
ncbi:Aldo/keto reductase [Blyttiomyces helicus]|uniref:Aldo/keto reductase n=1 Tax=Blyttiomyces helicus TaxID=388810 RepID=A0A4P9WSW6_9FUNG|nr:Aldo/keto reductase [Blyttiomyces helicus]|eukprot:RKO94126.1 Aldo/keto reductase [Blyttiomyces helicus]